MQQEINHFPIEGTPVECSEIKSGHINRTYLITTDTGMRYILQWINGYVFPNIDVLMGNVAAISAFLREHDSGGTSMISYIDTLDGQHYYNDGNGGAWRLYRFVENSVCHQNCEGMADFYESARGFGGFQYALRDFPADELRETIVDFHNTPDRYGKFRTAIEKNASGRAESARREIDYILDREERACVLHRMRERGELPVRVTHNDTKINNVLLDENTGKALCVIDLDTVMPGLAAYDFGDAIRFGASTAKEDEPNLSRVHFDLDMFRIFTRGFVEACPSLTQAELDALAQGAYTMTIECGMRFLTDYIDGDVYFSTDREGQNLDRCRTQLKLIDEMEQHWDELTAIVRQETARAAECASV